MKYEQFTIDPIVSFNHCYAISVDRRIEEHEFQSRGEPNLTICFL